MILMIWRLPFVNDIFNIFEMTMSSSNRLFSIFWKVNISLIFCSFASKVLAWINFEPVLFFHVVKGDYGFFAVQKNFNNVIVTCQNFYGYTPHITIVRTTRMKKINKNVNARPRDHFSCELQFSQMKMEHSKKET